jgi:hypothetical protein
MQKRNAEIVEDVRKCMDESDTNSSAMLGSTDNEVLNDIIESKLAEAYRWVNMYADEYLLDPVVSENGITRKGDKATLEMPYTTLRVLGIKLPSWGRYVSEFVRATDRAYAELQNPITTGTKDNPRVAVVNVGKNYMYELYGASDTDIKATVYHIKGWIEDDNNISDKVYDAMVTYCAGLVFKTFKDAHGDVLINQAMTMIK